MIDKVEKLLAFYTVLFVTSLLFIISVTTLFGPLILGLLFNPYCFLIYIFSILFSPLIIASWMLLPSMLKLAKEDY